ncbi:MAG TPA: AMP-binding protein [Burkholderiaceae bacterium]|nr:AMP-binding protein [Burkholderiaceae bacterium]
MHARPETLGDALTAQASLRPQAPALRFPLQGGELSFGEWHASARALAAGLRQRGLRPGERLALLAENRIEWPIVQMAAAYAGLVLVPINTHFRERDLCYALSQSGARAIVLSESFRSNDFLSLLDAVRPQLPALEQVFLIGVSRAGHATLEQLIGDGGRSAPADLPAVRPDDAAAIIYTSGTTGFPKGAVLKHRGVVANGTLMLSRLGVTSSDRITSIVPMFHSASYCATMPALLTLGCCYVGIDAFDPERMMRLISAERATVHIAVPTTLHAMLHHPRRADYDLSSLRVGTCGGSDVDPALMRECAEGFPFPGLVQVYGLTEACGIFPCSLPDDPARFDTAGTLLDGYELRIVVPGEPRSPAATSQIGEIEVRSRYTMLEYFDQPDATRGVLAPDGWLRTGDLGYLRGDGHLVLAGGRLKDMIIRGGENIYPAEIEHVLSAHPDVLQAAVFGIPDPHFGEVVAAAVRTRVPVGAAALADHCARQIARFKVPALFFRVDAYPLTPSGKIRKVLLRQMAADHRLEVLP